MASRIGRLHTFLRLHNAFHYIKRPEKDVTSLPSELSQARIEATLSLLLVSIFGAQSTPLSRRRRFWSQATTLREGQSDIKLDPWLEVALATDYDEACHAAFESDKFFPFASSSDFSPLRRIAEHRCIMALALVWNQLFISVIFNAARADFGDKLKWFPATKSTKDDQFAEKIRRVISSVAQDSPDLPLARLTLGFWALGVGDKQLAQQQASCLLGDLRQGGPSGYYASIPFFVTMVLPFSRELNFYAVNKPTTSLDMLALTSLQWLTLRRQYLRLVDNTVDARFYDATLSFRTVLNSSTWAAKELNQPDFQVDFVTAQSTCIQLVESMGRKAAGIGSALSSVSSSRSFDSGFEEEEEFF